MTGFLYSKMKIMKFRNHFQPRRTVRPVSRVLLALMACIYVTNVWAYRLQELEYAQHNPGLLERNKARIDQLIDSTKPRAKAGRGEVVKLVPGTMLTREFAGTVHRVVTMPDGQFEYMGKAYRSLTAISNEISGTRWSGPAFFGLRDKAAKGAAK